MQTGFKKDGDWGRLLERLAVVWDLRRATEVLQWDQQTYMPAKGAAGRAQQIATLSRIAHERFIAPETGDLLDSLLPEASALPEESDGASLVRVARRDRSSAVKVPPALVEEMSRTTSIALEAWQEARAASDFPLFLPHLEKIVGLSRDLADCLGWEGHPYDALLDQYEPGMTELNVSDLFSRLAPDLRKLVQAVGERSDRVQSECLHRKFDGARQWDFGLVVIRNMGFDFDRGRQDRSAHPFTSSFGLDDTRITTRIQGDYLPACLFGTIHECGHALYEMGWRPELDRTPLCGGASLGVHESQSRLWENVVGRSRGFWQHHFPLLQDIFPESLSTENSESFYRAVNAVRPSLIRVEADEVTYNLHILLRFELERDMVAGKLKPADIPEAWDAGMEAGLGVTPPDAAQGCLQDVHWSLGSIGYFPTYTLGTVFSAQLFERAVQDCPEIPCEIERGVFRALLAWLRENVHCHGRKFTLDELAKRVTDGPLDCRPFLKYLRSKYGELYGFPA